MERRKGLRGVHELMTRKGTDIRYAAHGIGVSNIGIGLWRQHVPGARQRHSEPPQRVGGAAEVSQAALQSAKPHLVYLRGLNCRTAFPLTWGPRHAKQCWQWFVRGRQYDPDAPQHPGKLRAHMPTCLYLQLQICGGASKPPGGPWPVGRAWWNAGVVATSWRCCHGWLGLAAVGVVTHGIAKP